MSEIHQGQVRANDVDFAYLEAGDGPLALCLHGFPDSAWGWEALLTDLAGAGFHAVAPFMRGYAPTSTAADGRYQTGVLALDAIALHEALGGDAAAVLIGHDWGALAAYGAATHASDRWRCAVAASVPPAEVMAPALLDYDNLKQRFWYQFFFCNPLSDVAVAMNDLAFLDRLWADWSPGLDASPHLPRVKDALRDPANLTAALSYYRQTLGGVDQDPAIADVQAATFQVPSIPMLYLHGTDDGCMPCPDRAALERVFNAEGSKVELIDGAGHFLQYEQPERVNATILEFLTS